MKKTGVALAIFPALLSIATAAQRVSSSPVGSAVPAVSATLGGANLPFQPIGVSDLIRINVSNAPELSQTFRVDEQGNLNLPLLHSPLPARGLMPDALRDKLAAALRTQHLLVNPVVDVSVVEYRSRDVTVSGAVKTPVTLQELGGLRLLGALSQAGGLLPDAGPEVIVEQPQGTVETFAVRELFDGQHPGQNIVIHAGAQIRVPQCQQVFVVGDVKRPGAFPFLSVGDTTVLQLLALSGGLDAFSRNKAYIYRAEAGNPVKREIEVPLRRILDRKASDVTLMANDILYVPINGKLKASATVLNHVTGMGNTAVSAAIWSAH
jgi:polysaccharide export outer membrane protein